jgi:hypothetical protein
VAEAGGANAQKASRSEATVEATAFRPWNKRRKEMGLQPRAFDRRLVPEEAQPTPLKQYLRTPHPTDFPCPNSPKFLT